MTVAEDRVREIVRDEIKRAADEEVARFRAVDFHALAADIKQKFF